MSPFLPLLAVLFVAFKLLGVTDVASWPWWLVLCPVWVYGVIWGIVSFFVFLDAINEIEHEEHEK